MTPNTPDTGTRVSLRGLSNVDAQPPTSTYLREIWNRREFAFEVPRQEVLARHMGTALGNFWHVLNPLLLMVVFWFTFAVVLHVNRGIPHYLTFLAVGIFTFGFTQRSVMSAAASISGNEGLLRSIYFPRAILPLSAVTAQSLTYFVDIIVMLGVAILNGVGLRWTLIFLPVVVAVQIVFNIGAGLVVAPINESYRDFRNALPYIFRLLMYVSGTMYSVTDRFATNPKVLLIFTLNPMYSFLEITRGVVMGTSTTAAMYLSVTGWTLGLLLGGFVLFRSREHMYGRG
jgi:teichoic acid transport system permease protein